MRPPPISRSLPPTRRSRRYPRRTPGVGRVGNRSRHHCHLVDIPARTDFRPVGPQVVRLKVEPDPHRLPRIRAQIQIRPCPPPAAVGCVLRRELHPVRAIVGADLHPPEIIRVHALHQCQKRSRGFCPAAGTVKAGLVNRALVLSCSCRPGLSPHTLFPRTPVIRYHPQVGHRSAHRPPTPRGTGDGPGAEARFKVFRERLRSRGRDSEENEENSEGQTRGFHIGRVSSGLGAGRRIACPWARLGVVPASCVSL